MPDLDRNVEVFCGNCGTSVTKQKLSRHKSNCSGGTLFCPKCPKFFTKSRDDRKYHFAKKHSAARPRNNQTFKECSFEFPSFYSLRHHKQRYHAAETTSSAENVEIQSLADAADDKSLGEELQLCRHFLVDSKLQKRNHSVFNFVVNNLTAQVNEEKLDHVLDKVKCAAKLNLPHGFILKNIEDGKLRYF